MTQVNRLPKGGRVDRTVPLEFRFNGRAYVGYQGDTLASALLANDVHFVARSWKYHRPRGIVSAGVEEPNAIVQLEEGAHTVPNAKATEIELYEGLVARSVNASPTLAFDRRAINQLIARLIPAGFYYKTFMWPRALWPRYERAIRKAAGLGTAPTSRDPSRYDKRYAHCDVLVVGGGAAGIAAAVEAGRTGARVILVDEQCELGGHLLSAPQDVAGLAGGAWIDQRLRELKAMDGVAILLRATAFGYQDHNLVTVAQRLHDHLPIVARRGTRELLWKVRARHVVLATGAHERPIVFGGNDLPGIMLSSAVSAYVNRYGVLPGRNAVVFTNNDGGYRCALDLANSGARVKVVDPRTSPSGALPARARLQGIEIIDSAVVVCARGKSRVRSAEIRTLAHVDKGPGRRLACDLIATSGGLNPAVHLFSQSGGTVRWDELSACFRPEVGRQRAQSIGAADGVFEVAAAVAGGVDAGAAATRACGFAAPASATLPQADCTERPLMPMWSVGTVAMAIRGPKQFVDLQNDVTVADILLAVREGFESIEHVKRYTALGFGTDQGKLGNINGMAILAEALGRPIPQVGTTTFRPNYTPVTFGAICGRELADNFEPVRKTSLHRWHVEQGAVFEDVGTWKRAWYYPRVGEDMQAAVRRECLAARTSVAVMDASTLGKIDIQGPDSVRLLNWVYTNDWSKLAVGRARYGLMLNENGMIMDDGVTVRLGEQHFLMSTTTGNAALVMNWLELWLQTEWRDMKVRLASVTDHWATVVVTGPRSRNVMRSVCGDVDFAGEAFPFMSYRSGTVAGVGARVMRISFSGELAYEVNVPAAYGRGVMESLMAAGREFGITPYGTEALHVLRAEKGFIIVGQDTDGSMTPRDMGMGSMVSTAKECLGKRSLARPDTMGPNRKEFVGLFASDPSQTLPEGAQILADAGVPGPSRSIGHVTSSYFSPALNRSIALGVMRDGSRRRGATVEIDLGRDRRARAVVTDTVFYDKEGVRQRVQ